MFLLDYPVASKKTAQNRVARIVAPLTTGFHRDQSWEGVSKVFKAISSMGGLVETQKTEYFAGQDGTPAMGKRWVLLVTANGFTFPAILTASFADKPNGDVYDLVLTT